MAAAERQAGVPLVHDVSEVLPNLLISSKKTSAERAFLQRMKVRNTECNCCKRRARRSLPSSTRLSSSQTGFRIHFRSAQATL
jgi:hypothetical protein